MDEKSIHELIQRKQVENSIKQEFEQTLSDRVNRYLQVKPHEIVPCTYFSAVSAECNLLFRDGHFYGCIALTQAVAETLVKFLCERNSWRPAKDFKKNVTNLFKRESISGKLKESLFKIWDKRHDYHHLNSNVATDRQALEELAREKVQLLVEVKREVFRFTVVDGKISPEQPKYWKANGDKVQVFLRLEP